MAPPRSQSSTSIVPRYSLMMTWRPSWKPHDTQRKATQCCAMQFICAWLSPFIVIPVHRHPPTTGYQPGFIHHLYSLYWIVPCTSTLILVVCLFYLRLIEEHG